MKGLAFYEAVAQLIPLLLVLFVLESRVFRGVTDDINDPRAAQAFLGGSLVVLSAVVGEVICLYVLQTGEASRSKAFFVWFSLFNLCAYITIFWLGDVRRKIRRQRRRTSDQGTSGSG